MMLKIALLGDSMTMTAGEECTALKKCLAENIQDVHFVIHNYGFGGTRAEYGLYRITHSYELWGKTIPALCEIQPDIVVLESFAYNNNSQGLEAIPYYLEVIEKIIHKIQETTDAKIIMAATIPPNKERYIENVIGFYQAPYGLRRMMAENIEKYIEAFIHYACQQNYMLADVYHYVKNLVREGNLCLEDMINPQDNIHPSDEGHKVIAEVITKTIKEARGTVLLAHC